MATNRDTIRKRAKTAKKQSRESLLAEAEALLASKKKRKKPSLFKFSTNPVTKKRNNKGTYSKKRYLAKKDSIECDNAQYSLDDVVDDFTTSTSTGELNNVLEEAKEFLANWKEKKHKAPQKWEDRMTTVIENWESQRPVLLENALKNYAMQDVTCQLCGDEEAIVKCEDCRQSNLMCSGCDIIRHGSFPLHDRLGAINGFYQAIPPNTAFDSCKNLMNIKRTLPGMCVTCPDCNMTCNTIAGGSESNAIFVSVKGRFDVQHSAFECPTCKKKFTSSSPSVVVQLGYWPGSIKNVNYIFDTNLFEFWHDLKSFIPGVSEAAFLKSLEQYSKKKGRVRHSLT